MPTVWPRIYCAGYMDMVNAALPVRHNAVVSGPETFCLAQAQRRLLEISE